MMRPPLVVPPSFRIVAHRGASAYAPENTAAAFEVALRLGVSEVELDVHMSRDGELMICHDRMLDRFGYPGLRIDELTRAELQSLDLGSWFSPHFYGGERMPTLDGLLRRFGDRFVYHIELKDASADIERRLIRCLSVQPPSLDYFVTSFDFSLLKRVRRAAPRIKLGLLTRDKGLDEEQVARARAIRCHQICPRASEAVAERVAAAHRVLAEVRVHRVRVLSDLHQAIVAGCDGATLDHPDWARHALRSEGPEQQESTERTSD